MINIINNPESTVAYLKLENYEGLLASGLSKRFLEKKGIRTLLEELGYENPEIAYKQTGQPFLVNSPEVFLSVSHANGWVAVSTGFKPVGIDIQTMSSRLKQGQSYFRNERERAFSDDENALHVIWGAKEAFYKLKEGLIPDLKEEVSVLSVDKKEVILEFAAATYRLEFRVFERVFLVFTC